MKITVILTLAACLQVSAGGYSQVVASSEKNSRLEKVFSIIKKQTRYTFFYQEELLQSSCPVNVTVKNVLLEEVLKIIFSDQPLTYTIIEKTVVIKAKATTAVLQPAEILSSFFTPPPIDVR